MSKITYNVNNFPQENVQGVEVLSEQDSNLVSSYSINSLFDSTKHYVELHITDLVDTVLHSDYGFINYKEILDSESAGKAGASTLYLDPVSDIQLYGFSTGDVKLIYHFLNDLYSVDLNKTFFYIEDISPDRTEIKLQLKDSIVRDLQSITGTLKSTAEGVNYLENYRVNFQDNNLLLITNIDTIQEDTIKVIVKLYHPLPKIYTQKSVLNIVEVISDSVEYEVLSEIEIPVETTSYLRSPNFNIEYQDESIIPTDYLNYDELLSYPVENSNSKIYSLYKEKSAELSIDYSDYTNFVNFSLASERLANFHYKLELLENYSSSLDLITQIQTPVTSSTQSKEYYENLIKGILENFDHYERHLYFTSGSTAWPKSNSTAPYENKSILDSESIEWYTLNSEAATLYDNQNYNNLINTVPNFIQEDPNNNSYLLFVSMIGQHFDNLWIYSKQLSEKYNADNRLDTGVSKDIVADVLKNFGVNLYTSKQSIEDLFNSFITQTSSTEGEIINHSITGSYSDTLLPVPKVSFKTYQSEIYKRIYHNLPLLTKSKGTERGLRALINCFGIPSDILSIKLYGGVEVNGQNILSDAVYVTSSLDKIRLDNQGQDLPENTLSSLINTHKPGDKYTTDLHVIEVGFSPTDDVDSYIKSQLQSSFDLDNYLGDPRNLYRDTYDLLTPSGDVSESMQVFLQGILQNLEQFNVKDYVRLLKFFDNVIFKMVKDFIPARSTSNTGVIIKPHVLDRSKVKFVQADVSFHHYSGSLIIEGPTGSHGQTFGGVDQYATSYTKVIQSPDGLTYSKQFLQSEAKYNGEFSQSLLVVSTGDLNKGNTFKYETYDPLVLGVSLISDFPTGSICTITVGLNTPKTLTGPSGIPYNIFNDVTNLGTANILITTGSTDITSTASAYTFPSINYISYAITASNTLIPGCTGSINYTANYCDIVQNPSATIPASVVFGSNTQYDLTQWVVQGTNTNITYNITYNSNTYVISNPTTFVFPSAPIGTSFVISVVDNIVGGCSVTLPAITEIQAPYECSYVTSVNLTKSYKDIEVAVPYNYSYIPYNGGLGGARVYGETVLEYEEKHKTIYINEQIVQGSFEPTTQDNLSISINSSSCA